MFTRTGATWSQRCYVKATNTGSGDNFGFDIALSADGGTLAAAPAESSAAAGVDGDRHDDSVQFAGATYIVARDR